MLKAILLSSKEHNFGYYFALHFGFHEDGLKVSMTFNMYDELWFFKTSESGSEGC